MALFSALIYNLQDYPHSSGYSLVINSTDPVMEIFAQERFCHH